LISDLLPGESTEWFKQLFRKLLIANRGEIACRIIRTTQRLNIPVATVYSDADRNALHSSLADESVYLGASRPSESYLNVDRIIEAAKQVGADALHPGYGFLSENSILAEACEKENIEFIGPSSHAIDCMASKAQAAAIAIEAGVPVLPGFRETECSDESLANLAQSIGFPVLLKAALGGGGRGMSIVHSEHQLAESLAAVKAQAKEFFGNDLIIIEKYLNSARHIEVQIAADKHGNAVHLFDRDCSAQRRYQKIVEEATAPQISQNTRERMYEAAISLTRALNYHSVGTVEFLLADTEFYFMEMNTRLQVEHTVTEQVAGVDLVEWQLRIAAGESISHWNIPSSPNGHSIQARIYAENPEKGFLPSPGHIRYLRYPSESDYLQMHTGVRQNDVVDVHYDPLIAKVVVSDSDRPKAIERLKQALRDLHVVGVDTNVTFLSNLITTHDFTTCTHDIKYVENNLPELTAKNRELPSEVLALALLYLTSKSSEICPKAFIENDDKYSPWRTNIGWRLNSRKEIACSFECNDQIFNVSALLGEQPIVVIIKEREFRCFNVQIFDHSIEAKIDEVEWTLPVILLEDEIYLFHQSSRYGLRLSDRLSVAHSANVDAGSLTAPLPGRIARVLVEEGESVSTGQVLIVVEAMKMEHPIASPMDGFVTSIPYSENQLVDEGASCIFVEPSNQSDRISNNE